MPVHDAGCFEEEALPADEVVVAQQRVAESLDRLLHHRKIDGQGELALVEMGYA